ncbi:MULTISPECIES: NAD(P)/FAD-dependent oxidoreductase [Paenarthrobacter]|uniref:FAD-dependent oxidoreductase n=1 Tax=Paenarthrobacter aromaticivorans TaxID=2849150 RepID=A0ABS6IAU1_9MICC|nr:FAD-dependent oxidoreductase [Paenarthrobacter sp. MMS21-TAE1-1]MBU8868540.1 FAD-dependent oxidoreductase [Paenarthrobacter sp. MMS21-TAE1-1]
MNYTYDTVIVGAGQAGVQVAQSLRQGGYAGSIALIGDDPHQPYERPPLSKAFLRGEVEASQFLLRSSSYWAEQGIETFFGTTVNVVSPADHLIHTSMDDRFEYRHLVWAAGGSPRRLPIEGAELDGVYSLRDLKDAISIREAMRTARTAVIIGGGHIGLEVAAALRLRGCSVTVIEAADRLLARVTSPTVSAFYEKLHRDRGVDIRTGSGVSEIHGTDGKVSAVTLIEGESLPVDLVLVGIGLVPSIEALAVGGVECSNGVNIDADGRTSVDGVFAAGDCANKHHPFANGERVRLESVPNATEQAKAVSNAILGIPNGKTPAPWFWSHQYEVKLQTVGLMTDYDEAIVRGDVENAKFSVVYLRDGRIIALDCINNVRDFAQGRQLVEAGAVASAGEVRDVDLLKSLLARNEVQADQL